MFTKKGDAAVLAKLGEARQVPFALIRGRRRAGPGQRRASVTSSLSSTTSRPPSRACERMGASWSASW
jgi:hypothetical protein